MTRQAHSFFGNFFTYATNLEDNTPRFDNCYIMINGTLTTSHACLSRFGRDRLIREDADPHFTTTLHKAGERNTRCFDLTSLQPTRLQSLHTNLPECERAAPRAAASHMTPPR